VDLRRIEKKKKIQYKREIMVVRYVGGREDQRVQTAGEDIENP